MSEAKEDEGVVLKVVGSRTASSDSTLILSTSKPKRLVIFGGKGGVGKTTAAAAYALALAEGDAPARVLLFSTDPAHSLSDSFDEQMGELKTGVGGRGKSRRDGD